MRKLCQIALVFALAGSLLNAGECGSPFFASKETRDCCNRGKCAPSNRSDDCCNVSNTTVSSAFVISGKSVIPNPLNTSDGIALAAVSVSLHWAPIPSSFLRAEHTWLAPPLTQTPLQLPLRI